MTIRKIILSPKGRVEIEPSFEGNPTFFVPVNQQPLKEGEIWEIETVGEPLPLGKKDKRGRDMFVQKVRLLNRYTTVQKAFYLGDNKWKVVSYSGPHPFYEEIVEGRKEDEVFLHRGEVRLVSYTRDLWGVVIGKEIIETIPTSSILNGDIPDWISPQTIEEIKQFEERKKSIKKSNQASIPSGGQLPQDLLREFVLRGVEVLNPPDSPDPRMSFYDYEGSFFKVGEFVFGLGIADMDEDYIEWAETFPTSAGDISDPAIIKIMKKIAFYAASPEHCIAPVLGIQKPEDKYLLKKRKWLAGWTEYSGGASSWGRTSEIRSVSEKEREEIISSLQTEVAQIQSTFTPSECDWRFQDLIHITWESSLESGVEVVTEVEEGIGMQDATTHYCEVAVAEAMVVWTVKDVQIADTVAPVVKEHILNFLKK